MRKVIDASEAEADEDEADEACKLLTFLSPPVALECHAGECHEVVLASARRRSQNLINFSEKVPIPAISLPGNAVEVLLGTRRVGQHQPEAIIFLFV